MVIEMIYANIINGIVFELFEPPAGAKIEECFTGMLWVDVSNTFPIPKPGWVATKADNEWLFAEPEIPAVDWRILAQIELTKSDLTILRCFELGVSVPTEWVDYRTTLRAIVRNGIWDMLTLPVRPPFPAGT